MNELQNMLKDLYLVFNLNLSIFDINGHLITSFPEKDSPFCALIKSNNQAKKHCSLCDHAAFKRVKDSGKMDIYRCHFNLYEACIPLYTYGVLSGYFMIGQTLTESSFDKEIIRNNAKKYISDSNILNNAINQIPYHSKDQLFAFAGIVDICAKYITITNRLEANQGNLATETKKYLIYNFNKDITIDDLCYYFNCSKSTLINSFKEEFHQTIHQFLLEYRIEYSLQFLNNFEYSIQEISIMCGFNDPSYFSKVFKKYKHMSPKAYRQSLNYHDL